jgi:glycosyltransferase involved in cell wall biosynthesis
MRTAVIIPALNEAGNIPSLIQEVRSQPAFLPGDTIIVVDNGSTDGTGDAARAARATVVEEPRRGYGYACAAGARAAHDADILLFLDGDHSSLPAEMHRLLDPIRNGSADFVVGSRVLGEIMPGAMPPHQRFGNWLAALIMRRLYGVHVTDLGPYRAIRRPLLQDLAMREMTYGWPTEMTVKAARRRVRMIETGVSYAPRRSGRSKVSGTIRGSFLAAYYILGVTFRYAWHD